MSFDPEFYNKSKDFQTVSGHELIDSISRDNPDRCFDTIIDIGCGDGNLTELLSHKIKHKRIIGLDINPEMIRFANENHKRSTIEYIVHDFSQDWHKFNSALIEIVGKVSLIFSNITLHWIDNKENVGKSFQKLLSKDGLVYINVYAVLDFNKHLNEEQLKRNEQLIKIPSFEEQMKVWENVFTINEINIQSTKISEICCEFSRQQIIEYFNILPKCYESYIRSSDPEELILIKNKFMGHIQSVLLNGNEEVVDPNAYNDFIANESNLKKWGKIYWYNIVGKTF